MADVECCVGKEKLEAGASIVYRSWQTRGKGSAIDMMPVGQVYSDDYVLSSSHRRRL